jgi:uncharacterized protein
VTLLLLFAAGFVGGVLNSLAGGGSFIVFPALWLAAGLPPVAANASNTYAALPGYVSGAVGFWADIVKHREKLWLYTVISLIFGFLGAELLLRVSNEQFELAVPWLMLFAVVLFAFGGQISGWVGRRSGSRFKLVGTIALLALLAAICVYGGFFNAGLGILLLAFFALAGFTQIHEMNGLKLWISSVIALVAVVRFAFDGAIVWFEGTVALAGVVIGGFAGARAAYRIPQVLIRALVIVYGLGMTGYFFWDVYLA